MDKEQFQNTITEIGSCEDVATIRTKLATLSEETSSVFDDIASLTEEKAGFEKQIKDLQENNMKLFLQVGNKQKENNPGEEPPREKLKYEDLFNEKGELK